MAITEGDYLQIPRVDPVTNEDVPEDITDEVHDAMVGYLPNGRIGFHLIEAARRDSPATISVWRTHTRNNDGTITELDPHVLLDGPRSVAPSSGQFYFSYDWNAVVLPASEINASAPVDPDDKGAQGNRFRVAYRGTGASNHIANQQKIQDDALNARPTFDQLATSGGATVHHGNIPVYYHGPYSYIIDRPSSAFIPVPPGCNQLTYHIVGGGGGGGPRYVVDGGGGGSGGHLTGTISVDETSGVYVSVGAGGIGASGEDGASAGGNSFVRYSGSQYAASGGGAGGVGSVGAGGSPGGNPGSGTSGGASPYGGYGSGGDGAVSGVPATSGGSGAVELIFGRVEP